MHSATLEFALQLNWWMLEVNLIKFSQYSSCPQCARVLRFVCAEIQNVISLLFCCDLKFSISDLFFILGKTLWPYTIFRFTCLRLLRPHKYFTRSTAKLNFFPRIKKSSIWISYFLGLMKSNENVGIISEN